ncbi:MAG: amidotransferase [Cyanobacteria bacterium M5B4]|nr:MAG: amidotransferase [Cyanobacteria bacterium M5B4]
MHIHYLQHVPFEGLASIQTWITNHNHSLSNTKFYQNDPLPELKDFDWLIILGGPMNIDEEDKYPWLKEEKRLIQQAITANKIVLGVCLGAQLIADVLGAKVYQGEHKEIGWFPIELINSDLFQSLPPTMTVFHWHGDTFDNPPGATRLASSEACPNQAFVYNRKVLGLQFHLESTPESVEAIIAHCSHELVPGRYIQTPQQMQEQPDRFQKINQFMEQILSNLSGT